jgi:putative transposase
VIPAAAALKQRPKPPVVYRSDGQSEAAPPIFTLSYVIMPEHVHLIVWPTEKQYEMRLIRAALMIPVQRKALAYLRHRAPRFLERLKDRQPNAKVHYRFWQRGGGYDRNIVEPQTVRTMIEYIHCNPVRRGLP